MGEFSTAQRAIGEFYDEARVLASEYGIDACARSTDDFDELAIPPCDVIEQVDDKQLAWYAEEFGSEACRKGLRIQRLTRQVGLVVMTTEFQTNRQAGIRIYRYDETRIAAANYPQMSGMHRSGKVQRNRFAGTTMPIQVTEWDFLRRLPHFTADVRRAIQSAHDLSR